MEASADTIGAVEARESIAKGEAQVIDIRDKEEWLDGHIPGALHGAGDQLETQVGELSEEKPVILVGDDEGDCAEAVKTLQERGFEVSTMKGGMKAWKDQNFTLQPSQDPDLEGDFDPSEEEGEPAG